MNALILAAGTGSRLLNLTRDLPKALVEVNGRTLIDFSIGFLESLECDKITVVGGFYFDKLKQYVSTYHQKALTIENSQFLKGSILSLMAGLHYQEDTFLLMNVDHIYPAKMGKIFKQRMSNATAVTAFVDFDRPLGEDDMKVTLANDRKIRRISKDLHEFDAGYIGVTYVPPGKLDQYKEAAMKVAAENESAAVESVLQWLATNSDSPEIFDASGIRWLEIDNQIDLNNANRILKWVANYLD